MSSLLHAVSPRIKRAKDGDLAAGDLIVRTYDPMAIAQSAIEVARRFPTDPVKILFAKPDDYKWNVYTELGLEDFSFITQAHFEPILTRLAAGLQELTKSRYFVTPTQPSNLFGIINNDKEPITNTINSYKIHLMVKPEYILYTFLKLKAISIHPKFVNKRIGLKMNFDSRSQKPFPEDTGLTNNAINGGAAPTIVIYSSIDNSFTGYLIKAILDLFREEEEQIGLMDITGSESIPTFNVRLNHLVAYASGDRGKKLDRRLANRGRSVNESTLVAAGTFQKPQWIIDLQNECSIEKTDEINRQSDLYLGIPLCGEDGKKLPDPEFHNMLYLASKKDMLSPFEIPETSLDASASAAGAAAGAGAGAGAGASIYGGRRRKHKSKTHKNTKMYRQSRRKGKRSKA